MRSLLGAAVWARGNLGALGYRVRLT